MEINKTIDEKLSKGLITVRGICQHLKISYGAYKRRKDDNSWRLNEVEKLKEIL